jgi:hypothetical protein
METVKASIMWPGPDVDVLTLFVEPTPDLWEADPVDDDWEFMVLRALDENEQETGEIAGVEMIGFLDFDRWEDLPEIPLLWQLPGWEPLPLEELLKREQQLLREKASASPREQAGTR